MKTILIAILIGIAGCHTFEKKHNVGDLVIEEITTDTIVTPETKAPDSMELIKFWNDCIIPIINLDKEKLKPIVNFPLIGEWGFMIELKKPETEWTEKDFYENLHKLFFSDFIDSLKTQTYKNIDIYNYDNGQTDLIVSVGFAKWEDDFKNESAIILRFKQWDAKWKLYAIIAAG